MLQTVLMACLWRMLFSRKKCFFLKCFLFQSLIIAIVLSTCMKYCIIYVQ